jgi:hypothetical protein
MNLSAVSVFSMAATGAYGRARKPQIISETCRSEESNQLCTFSMLLLNEKLKETIHLLSALAVSSVWLNKIAKLVT